MLKKNQDDEKCEQFVNLNECLMGFLDWFYTKIFMSEWMVA